MRPWCARRASTRPSATRYSPAPAAPPGTTLLKIAFAMGCTLREANRLLQAGGANELYCKNRRDAIVIFAISHGYTLQKTEEELYRFDEATIS